MHRPKINPRAGLRGLLLLCLLALVTACDDSRDAEVRLADVWVAREGLAATPISLTHANVTRSGIPLARDLSAERFEFRVPRAGVLQASLGVLPIGGSIPDPAPRVDFVAAPCPTRRDARREAPIGRVEFEGFGWHAVEIDLGAYSRSDIDLCLFASSSAKVVLLLADAVVVSTAGDPVTVSPE